MSATTPKRIALAAVVAIVLLGAAARITALFDAFWLDEIWSWGLAKQAGSFLGVLRIAHDNNHQLNTLWIRLLGEDAPWPAYRLLALVSGVGTIALAARLAWDRSRLEAAFAGALVACSLYFTVYGSEARGYAPMLFCALAATASLRRVFERPSAGRCALFSAWVVLGTASHFAFAHAYGALVVWSAVEFARPRFDLRTWTKRMGLVHAVPLAFWIAEYALFVRGMKIGGGPIRSLADVLSEALTHGFGAPDGPAWALVVAALLGTILVADTVLARRAGSSEWILTICAVLVVPALTLILFRPQFLAPRYLLVSILFALLAVARVAAAFAVRGRAPAALAFVVVLAIVAGNGVRVVEFLATGRGHYREALDRIVADTRGEVTTLSGPEYFDLTFVVSFHGRDLPASPRIALVPPGSPPTGGTDWIVIQSDRRSPDPKATMRFNSRDYRLVETFPRSGPSGVHWMLYRRAD